MDWKDRLQWLRWRAVEEADVEGALLGLQMRGEATKQGGMGRQFMRQRMAWLHTHALVHGPEVLVKVMAAMREPDARFWPWLGWLMALGLGYWLTELGSDRRINLLAVPLMGLLLWNFAVIIYCLLAEWRASPLCMETPGWLRWQAKRIAVNEPGSSSSRVLERFRTLAGPMITLRLNARARAWLHLAAAWLVLGTITGMYAKGWSREYQAVWESTLLDAETAKAFLNALYHPASVVFRLPLPLEHFEAMRDGPGRSPQPGEALPWIHLYAGTLVLLVLLQRLALAWLAIWRGRQRVDHAWAELDWGAYSERLQMMVAGAGQHLEVLAYGWRSGEAPRERWAATLRERYGGMSLLSFSEVPAGDEDAFIQQWQPQHAIVVLVFNAASTPEAEVQGALAHDLRQRLRERLPTAKLVLLLDVTTLEERRSPQAADTRLKLWHDTLREWADEIACTRVP